MIKSERWLEFKLVKNYVQKLLWCNFFFVVSRLITASSSKPEHWDFMVFTQQWPQSVCQDLRRTVCTWPNIILVIHCTLCSMNIHVKSRRTSPHGRYTAFGNNRTLYSGITFILWYIIRPNAHGQLGPNFCNESAKFDFKALEVRVNIISHMFWYNLCSHLQPILSELLMVWPNMYTDEVMDSFWLAFVCYYNQTITMLYT